MKLSINPGYFHKVYGGGFRTVEDTIRLVKSFGFDTVDLSLGSTKPETNIIYRENYLEEAKKMRAFADSEGVEINQSHARFDYTRTSREDFMTDMLKTVDTSALLGVKTVVIHADTFYDKNGITEPDKVETFIYDTYAPMVERAEKKGIKIAMETLFDDGRAEGNKHCRYCSYIYELNSIVRRYNTDAVGICWDFGHARVVYGDDQFRMMRMVGDKIISTHVHDNYGSDMHLYPFLGKTDWQEGLATLKKIGYSGAFTFEFVYGCLPEELLYDYGKIFYKTGKYMLEQIEKA